MKTNAPPRAILSLVNSPPAQTSISPETVSQVGGVLLLAVAVVELWLAVWAVRWWHPCGASFVSAVGAASLVRAVATIALPVRTELPRRKSTSRPRPPAGVLLAEPAQR